MWSGFVSIHGPCCLTKTFVCIPIDRFAIDFCFLEDEAPKKKKQKKGPLALEDKPKAMEKKGGDDGDSEDSDVKPTRSPTEAAKAMAKTYQAFVLLV